MKKWMKKVLIIIGMLVMLGGIGIRIWLSKESTVKKIVIKYEQELNEYAEMRLTSGTKEEKKWFSWDIRLGRGEVPSVCFSVYYKWENDKGFYYSKTGEPLGFMGETENLEPDKSGAGWIWEQAKEEKSGHDVYYTEKIVGNWYWYDMQW